MCIAPPSKPQPPIANHRGAYALCWFNWNLFLREEGTSSLVIKDKNKQWLLIDEQWSSRATDGTVREKEDQLEARQLAVISLVFHELVARQRNHDQVCRAEAALLYFWKSAFAPRRAVSRVAAGIEVAHALMLLPRDAVLGAHTFVHPPNMHQH
jgi:hypothetical protein